MVRGHLLIASIVSSLCAIIPIVAALFAKEWYIVTSYSSSFSFGLTDMCTANDGCGAIDFDALLAMTADSCVGGVASASADDVKSRLNTIQYLLIATAIIAGVQSVAGCIVFGFDIYRSWIARIALAVITLVSPILAIVVMAVFPSTPKDLFCGSSYCEALNNPYQDCSNENGYGYALTICGGCILIVAFILTAVIVIKGWDREWRALMPKEVPAVIVEERPPTVKENPEPIFHTVVVEEKVEEEPEPPVVNPEPPTLARKPRKRYPNEPPLPKELQDGDWEYDPDTGYFWSEDNKLYFEPETHQFYDPHSNAWFNPETELWYKPLEENEGDLVRPNGNDADYEVVEEEQPVV